MATSYTPLAISSTPAIIHNTTTLPSLLLLQCHRLGSLKSTTYYRRIGRNVMATATRDGPVITATETSEEASELPEIVTTVRKEWDKVDDKYAVASLGVAVIVALWASTGLIYAIDRLPIIPGVLELVGIGYTGWFVYRNLVFQPDREALIEKIKTTYKDIIGSS